MLSIIVPVFNEENSLRKCVNSLLEQDIDSYEIVLVDDGSTDGSAAICDEYASEYRMISVVHKANGGLVSAQRAGVMIAKGDMIGFCDADDYVDSNMYKYMLEVYENNSSPDMVSVGVENVYESENRSTYWIDNIPEGYYSTEEIKDKIVGRAIYDYSLNKRIMTTSLCNKIINKSKLIEVLKYISDELSLGEDGVIIYALINIINSLYISHRILYHYIHHSDSMNNELSFESMEHVYHIKQNMENSLNNTGWIPEMQRQIYFYVKMYLERIENESLRLNYNMRFFVFPYEKVAKGSNIIIYGAGAVGRCFANALMHGDYAKVIAWCDKNYMKCQREGMNVISPSMIPNIEFDYIVLAVLDSSVRNEIRKTLMDMGVQEHSIISENIKFFIP